MMWVGESILGHGRIVPPIEAEAAFAAVTPADIQAAAQACLRDGFRAVVAVGPVEATGEDLLGWFGGLREVDLTLAACLQRCRE